MSATLSSSTRLKLWNTKPMRPACKARQLRLAARAHNPRPAAARGRCWGGPAEAEQAQQRQSCRSPRAGDGDVLARLDVQADVVERQGLDIADDVAFGDGLSSIMEGEASLRCEGWQRSEPDRRPRGLRALRTRPAARHPVARAALQLVALAHVRHGPAVPGPSGSSNAGRASPSCRRSSRSGPGRSTGAVPSAWKIARALPPCTWGRVWVSVQVPASLKAAAGR